LHLRCPFQVLASVRDENQDNEVAITAFVEHRPDLAATAPAADAAPSVALGEKREADLHLVAVCWT